MNKENKKMYAQLVGIGVMVGVIFLLGKALKAMAPAYLEAQKEKKS